MNDNNTLFATALQKKLRFVSRTGQIGTEDLFDLSLAALDKMAVAVSQELDNQQKTFLETPSRKASEDLGLAFAVLKEVISIKQTAAKAKAEAADKRARRAFLMDLKSKKETQQLEQLSVEDIDKQLAALEG